MTPAREAELLRSLTGIARRVLDATPISETWSASQICSEVGRRGTRADLQVVAGCLASLRRQGLVREPDRGFFSRPVARPPEQLVEPIKLIPALMRPNAAPEPEQEACMMSTSIPPTTPPAEKKVDPLALLESAAARMRSVARTINEAADDIEAAGLHFEQKVESASIQSDKLRQLSQLIRDIGGGV